MYTDPDEKKKKTKYLADRITSIENVHVLKKWIGQCSSRVPVRLEELKILSSFLCQGIVDWMWEIWCGTVLQL
jgi:hypothetical protein